MLPPSLGHRRERQYGLSLAETHLARLRAGLVLDRVLRTRDRVLEARQHAAALDAGREVVDRDHVVAGVERLLDRRLLLALGRAVVPGRRRLVVEHLPGRVDDLVVDV